MLGLLFVKWGSIDIDRLKGDAKGFETGNHLYPINWSQVCSRLSPETGL
jgi:hypothetical protein